MGLFDKSIVMFAVKNRTARYRTEDGNICKDCAKNYRYYD